ncbi:EAL domain-containing protein [Vibrio sp. RE86]|uniref:sensor domain-containing phosphodiesterase n=1 Tax=Vibrio sp. RE86 TaxID=2607605 RepID=UPI001493393A|nr:EAL domain-containing protein [Vibrio sp. RE86]NOH81086.1 EAL domain-containing protein [Vibrio sp. RE86]
MSQNINSIRPRPKITLVSEMSVDEIDAGMIPKAGLTGAELDDLMDNHFSHMIDVMTDGIFYMADSEHVCFYNPSFYARFGIDSGHTCLQRWLDLVHPLDRKVFRERVDVHIQEDESRETIQYRIRTTNGQYVWLEGTAITKTVNGKRFMIGCHKDISDRKLMESYVKQSSFTDGSSGLSNEQKLGLDMDNLDIAQDYHLMYIQPTNGHSYQTLYGSQIMRNLLSHLTGTLNDFPDRFVDLYRIQSNDFAILLRGQYNEETLQDLAHRVAQAYQDSVKAIDFIYAADISIGTYPNITPDLKVNEVLKIAAQTCQFASNQRSQFTQVYTGQTKSKVDRHFYIEKELGNAINSQKLSVKFQPIVCSKSHRVASFESLVRWKSDDIGEIYPDEFISIAESKGLISELGYFVFESACRFIKDYQSSHCDSVRVNVNVSVLQLMSQQFPDKLARLTKLYGINASSIVLELTETIILDDNKNAAAQLNVLKQHGFQLSLDDFGAGYSSLNSFFDLPLSQIKIDKSIAWRSLENPVTFEYLSFITNLCNAYAIDIVIEGIEDGAMQRVFTDMGVSYLQGYWFSKPLSLASASHYTKV